MTEHNLESVNPNSRWPQNTLERMAQDVAYVNRLNGWYDDNRTFFDELFLLASEVFEAGDAWRDHGFHDVVGPGCPAKPLSVGSELADVLIRLLDTAYRNGIDLMAEYQRKVKYNLTRGYRHGGKRL